MLINSIKCIKYTPKLQEDIFCIILCEYSDLNILSQLYSLAKTKTAKAREKLG